MKHILMMTAKPGTADIAISKVSILSIAHTYSPNIEQLFQQLTDFMCFNFTF